ncbi:methyltransferase [Lentzea sp. NBRC 105346]|uniref:class I SAM-dependent DNA methyltransferase n=1 Tax=Lentzea sp. NBRC 105346 TaxID=3032205 RepID=UPI0024A13183|nr:class I SAM-dependent methyltransferase [Lentzea sp. NBRC 105346]GLZ33211.1 methyltransferase [Lentzea sp. NBRC 105346]
MTEQVRESYDRVADSYAELLRDELADKPFDRAVLSTFAALATGPVADIGCGPGRVSAHLHDLGVEVSGIDLSPGMIAAARREHPDLSFDVGSLFELPHADGSLAGALAWYSLVHTPMPLLPSAFAEFARVLEPGGHLLVAFKVGNEHVRLEHAYGHPVALDVYRWPVDTAVSIVRDAGFEEVAMLVRDPDAKEASPQGFLLARKR